MRLVIVLFTFLFFNTLAHAANEDIYAFSSPTQSVRFQALTNEIRCVVCQNQSINDSNAPLAKDLREKVYRMVVENRSDQEIKNWLVKRYGEFILLEPKFTKLTLALWLFPILGIILILFLFIAPALRQRI